MVLSREVDDSDKIAQLQGVMVQRSKTSVLVALMLSASYTPRVGSFHVVHTREIGKDFGRNSLLAMA
jgi:hypothetical protein